eukprot:2375203-Pyramimonas_sp.AAC.1
MAGKAAQEAHRPWSQCAGCSAYEWNDVLLSRACRCARCNRPVKLYKPKTRKGTAGTDLSDDQTLSLSQDSKGAGKG